MNPFFNWLKRSLPAFREYSFSYCGQESGVTENVPVFKQIGAVFIPVSNIYNAKDWYCNLLGIPCDGQVFHGHLYVMESG